MRPTVPGRAALRRGAVAKGGVGGRAWPLSAGGANGRSWGSIGARAPARAPISPPLACTAKIAARIGAGWKSQYLKRYNEADAVGRSADTVTPSQPLLLGMQLVHSASRGRETSMTVHE